VRVAVCGAVLVHYVLQCVVQCQSVIPAVLVIDYRCAAMMLCMLQCVLQCQFVISADPATDFRYV